MLPSNIKLCFYILFACAKKAMSKDMLRLLAEWLWPWEWWWVSNTQRSINRRQVFGLSPSWSHKRIAFHGSPATGDSGAKFPKWRHSQYFLLFLKGGAELSPTLSLKWIELAKHFFEINLSFMSQMKYDYLHIYVCSLLNSQMGWPMCRKVWGSQPFSRLRKWGEAPKVKAEYQALRLKGKSISRFFCLLSIKK